MLPSADQRIVEQLGRRYGVRRILLFGSAVAEAANAQDFDLAVDGLAPSRFLRFYADLLARLSKPVDLVDLAEHSQFTELVQAEGVVIYAHADSESGR